MNFFPNIDFSMAGYNQEYDNTHRHIPTYYGIQYNHSGPLRLCIDKGQEWRVNGPHVFITHPDAFFDYGSVDGEPRHHIFICFHGLRVQEYIRNNFLPLNSDTPLIRIRHPEKFHKAIYELIMAVKLNNMSHDRMVLMLEDLLLQLHEQEDKQKRLPPWQTQYFEHLLDSINNKLPDEWDFNKEAVKRNMTPTHFRRLFKQISGLPPRQYLLHQRLHKAAEYLLASSDTVSDIATEVGIHDHFYFSKAFKLKYGISPLAYRKEFLGK